MISSRMLSRPITTDPARSCRISVTAPTIQELQLGAILTAAGFLGEDPDNLWVSYTSEAEVARHSRFRRHLAEVERPISWRATCTVKLKPEVLREREEASDESPKTSDERNGVVIIFRPRPGTKSAEDEQD